MRKSRSLSVDPKENFPTELTSDEEIERNIGEWRRKNVRYCMNVMEWLYPYVLENIKNSVMPHVKMFLIFGFSALVQIGEGAGSEG
jgi:hypothetical protein